MHRLKVLRIRLLIGLLISCALLNTAHAQQSLKLSLGEYRILDGADSYGFTSINSKYSSQNYQASLSLPYISGYRGESGVGNVAVKLAYLTQWRKNYIDLNYRQKLATADDQLTVPAWDTGMSIELARYLVGGVGFMELGYNWRHKAQGSQAERKNSLFYALGGSYPLMKYLSAGMILDHKPTALGQLNRNITGFAQYKLNQTHRIGVNAFKGLTQASPNWTLGLVWTQKF